MSRHFQVKGAFNSSEVIHAQLLNKQVKLMIRCVPCLDHIMPKFELT